MSAPRIVVIGLGNPDRGDDGVGPAVVTELRRDPPPGVELLERRGDMLALLDDWAGADVLICIDAAASLGGPGRIHRIDLGQDELPGKASPASSHALGLADAVALARVLGSVPGDVVVFAIEGEMFDGGAPLSAPVAASVPRAADGVRSEIARLRTKTTEPIHA